MPETRVRPEAKARGHEPTDVNPKLIAAALVLWAVIVLGGMLAALWMLSGFRGALPDMGGDAPAALQQAPAPPVDMAQYRQEQRERLTSFGWIDRDEGIVRIPIEDAMRIMAERGWEEGE